MPDDRVYWLPEVDPGDVPTWSDIESGIELTGLSEPPVVLSFRRARDVFDDLAEEGEVDEDGNATITLVPESRAHAMVATAREEGRQQGRAERDEEVRDLHTSVTLQQQETLWARDEIARQRVQEKRLVEALDESLGRTKEGDKERLALRAELATLRATYAELETAGRAWRAQYRPISDANRELFTQLELDFIEAIDALPAQTKETSDGTA